MQNLIQTYWPYEASLAEDEADSYSEAEAPQ